MMNHHQAPYAFLTELASLCSLYSLIKVINVSCSVGEVKTDDHGLTFEASFIEDAISSPMEDAIA